MAKVDRDPKVQSGPLSLQKVSAQRNSRFRDVGLLITQGFGRSPVRKTHTVGGGGTGGVGLVGAGVGVGGLFGGISGGGGLGVSGVGTASFLSD